MRLWLDGNLQRLRAYVGCTERSELQLSGLAKHTGQIIGRLNHGIYGQIVTIYFSIGFI